MIKRVFRFSDRRARALMTPRNDIVWIDQADPADEIRRKIDLQPPHPIPRLRPEPRQPAGNRPGQGPSGTGPERRAVPDQGAVDPAALPLRGNSRAQDPGDVQDSRDHASQSYSTNMEPSRACSPSPTSWKPSWATCRSATKKTSPRRSSGRTGRGFWTAGCPWMNFATSSTLTSIPEGDFHTLAGLVVTQLGHIPRVGESFPWLGTELRGRRHGWQPRRSHPRQAVDRRF